MKQTTAQTKELNRSGKKEKEKPTDIHGPTPTQLAEHLKVGVDVGLRKYAICRIPQKEEELARHTTRLRQQLREYLQRMAAQGRSRLWQFGYVEEGSSW